MDKFPSIEKLAAFFDGNLPDDEMLQFSQLAADNGAIHDIIDANTVIDESMASFDKQDLQLQKGIIGMDFELPDIDEIGFISADGDRFLGGGNPYHKDENLIVDFLSQDSQSIQTINKSKTMLKQTIGEIEPFPSADSETIHQGYEDTCAIKSQQIVLTSFGHDISEDQLVREAIDMGVYVPGHGTSMADVGALLNAHDVSTHTIQDAHVYDLVNELAQGHKVIAGVDSDELWHPSFLEKVKDIFGGRADHALVVTGIDTTDPNNVQVIITDPGRGDVAARYPMSQFLDAWRDSHCTIVATDDPVPVEHEPAMVNFDYAIGHIPYVGEMPFDYFSGIALPQIDHYFADSNIFLDSNDTDDLFNHVFDAFSSYEVSNGIEFIDLL